MIRCFFSCLTRLIRNRKDARFGVRKRVLSLKSQVLGLMFLAYSASAQTPVFKGEERDRVKEIKEIAFTLLGSQTFYFVAVSIGIAIVLYVLYDRKKDISKLGLEAIKDDTWFITRDDNNRVGIVVSVNLSNKSTRGVSIVDCKLSGYSAREYPDEVHLSGPEEEQKLNFPEHRHFSKAKGYYLGPYTSESLWFYYESRIVTMRNLLKAPFTLRDSDKKRKTIRLDIPRQADQIEIYKEMAKMW
jgi:hypothetical protein